MRADRLALRLLLLPLIVASGGKEASARFGRQTKTDRCARIEGRFFVNGPASEYI